MSNNEGIGNGYGCPIHEGFLQAIVHLQQYCNINTRYAYSHQLDRRCKCSLHQILIQVKINVYQAIGLWPAERMFLIIIKSSP